MNMWRPPGAKHRACGKLPKRPGQDLGSSTILAVMVKLSCFVGWAITIATTASLGTSARAEVLARPPSNATCIPRDALFNTAKLDGALTLCTSDEACWRVDIAADKWSPTAKITIPMGESPDAVEVSSQGFKICNPSTKACETIVLPKVDTADEMGGTRALTNADQSLIAVSQAQGPLRVFDLKTRKLLHTVKPLKSMMTAISNVRFLGSTLYVMSAATPISSSGRLYNARTGKLMLDIGKKGADVDEHMPLALGGDRYAFAAWMLSKMFIVNVKTGKVLKQFPLGGDPKKPVDALILLANVSDNRILAVATTMETALVQVVDPLTGFRTVLKAPGCAK